MVVVVREQRGLRRVSSSAASEGYKRQVGGALCLWTGLIQPWSRRPGSEYPQEAAEYSHRSLVVRMPNIGGAEKPACFSYSLTPDCVANRTASRLSSSVNFLLLDRKLVR